MPRQVIHLKHETWCTDHSSWDGDPLCSSSLIQFGPQSTEATADRNDRAGYLFLMQQSDEAPEVSLFFPTTPHTHDSTLTIDAIRQLLAALDHDADDTIAALRRALTLHDQESA